MSCTYVAMSQDSLMNSTAAEAVEQKPVKIFNALKAINAKTTEVVGKGKMEFNVTHNFGDIGGKFGGIKNFFGLDNAVDVRIGFEIGIGKKLDIILARAKGASNQSKLFETGIKYQVLRQFENDPSHPIAMTAFVNAVVATNTASTTENVDNSYDEFTDRLSSTMMLIIAKKNREGEFATESYSSYSWPPYFL